MDDIRDFILFLIVTKNHKQFTNALEYEEDRKTIIDLIDIPIIRLAIVEKTHEILELILKFKTLDDTDLLILFHYAVDKQEFRSVEMLLEKGAHINSKNQYESTALHKAVELQNPELVNLFLSKGANPNSLDVEEKTPLHRAAAAKNQDILQMLLDHPSINVNAEDEEDRVIPLFCAIENDNPEFARMLLEAGSLINFYDFNLMSPLMYAVMKNDYKTAELLLELGAHINATHNFDKITVLDIALKNQNEEMAILLLHHGACGHVEDEKEFTTPLTKAARFGYTEVVRMLLQTGVDVEGKHMEDCGCDKYEAD